MEVIGKNKIVDYIRQYPEFTAAIVFAFKEFPYRIKSQSTAGIGSCDTQLGRSGYWLRYSTNLWFQTAHVIYFGTNDELKLHTLAELERFKAENPGVVLVTKEVSITTPVRKPSDKQTPKTASLTLIKANLGVIEANSTIIELLTGEQLNTTAEYEMALQRAIAIFKSKPDTPEFDELALLLPQIIRYERTHIILPKLEPLDIIKLKMAERDMSQQQLARFLRTSEKQVELLLNGDKPFSDIRLAKLFNYFRVPYLINNPDFFA